jgi:hypothetical protein
MTTGAVDLTIDPYAVRIGETVSRYLIRNPVEAPWPTTEVTVEAWGKIDSGQGAGASKFLFSYARAAEANEIALSLNSLQLTLYINGTATSDPVALADDGAWHHFVGTWNSSGGALALYVDGVLRHSASSVQSAYSIVGGGALVLGQDQDSLAGGFAANQAWEGEMDEVRVYRRVLSAAEVSEHYNRRFTNEQKLVGHWKFDRPAGQALLNPGGEVGDGTGWTFEQAAVVNDGNARTGSYAIKYDGDGTSGPNQINNTRLRVRPGDHVVTECWVKTAAGTGTTSLAVRFYDESDAAVGGRTLVTGGVGSIAGPVAAYTLLYGTAIAPAGAAYCRFDVGENTANNTSTPWYFDDCFLGLSIGADSGPLGNHLAPVGITEVTIETPLRRTWTAIGGLLRFGGVEEAGDPRGQGLDVTLSGVTQTAIAVLLGGTTYRGRRMRIWRAHLDSALGTVVDAPLMLFEGLQLSPYEIRETRDSRDSGTVTIKTRIRGRLGIERARGIWASLTSHQHLFPGDTFFQHVAQLANSRVFWGTTGSSRLPGAGSGAGGGIDYGPDGPMEE